MFKKLLKNQGKTNILGKIGRFVCMYVCISSISIISMFVLLVVVSVDVVCQYYYYS